MLVLRSLRWYFGASVVLFALTALSTLAYAIPTELFISEYVEGSSYNKALEFYNGTESAIDLDTAGYNVQIFYNGGATAGYTIPLTGTVFTNDVYVLAHLGANEAILAQADQTGSGSWFNGNDTVVLRKGETIIDVFGQVGFDPGTTGWGTVPISTADATLQRKSSIWLGDTNSTDAFHPSIEWNVFALDTFSGLGTHSVAAPPVPIPSTLLLLGSGLVGLVGIGRKRMKK